MTCGFGANDFTYGVGYGYPGTMGMNNFMTAPGLGAIPQTPIKTEVDSSAYLRKQENDDTGIKRHRRNTWSVFYNNGFGS